MFEGGIDSLPTSGIALVVAIAVLVAVLVVAASVTRRALRVIRAWDAAQALLDVHLAAVDDAALDAARRADRLADSSEELAPALADLRDSIEGLQELLAAAPKHRASMLRVLADFALPTRPKERARGR